MPNTSVQAAAEGLPITQILSRDPLTPRGRVSCDIEMAELRKMDMKELRDLRKVLYTVAEVISGFCCQPRFLTEDGKSYNAAGNVLEEICDFLGSYEQAAVNISVAAKPETSSEVEWRGWTILSFEADCSEDLAPFAVKAAEFVRDEAEARSREARRPMVAPDMEVAR
ncbi:hypothetical protein GOE04_11490 [Sinorhizobium medicae]|uniref:hypothetical protein n=1 Tax=Sinorhizobium medicae TaxID=110321 RepID=UPI001AACD6A1|nr:hypothetical protein [Sinorhizobium medicae]MBO1943149.1 hypothetical protein [Sinorhizobium medicae]MDX0921791.1 hypothetical protein [Sinorhizobium medicae]MDX0926655.1 hypothetical protein [Sinorhizobium medicae]MDX0934095.1 hypothetical protein [Sinorhizobium medicae]MDX0940325.1 hypothetical protein [Sinorhizobium medicae]